MKKKSRNSRKFRVKNEFESLSAACAQAFSIYINNIFQCKTTDTKYRKDGRHRASRGVGRIDVERDGLLTFLLLVPIVCKVNILRTGMIH